MKEMVIQARCISKRFGNKAALNQLSFEIYKGEIFGFLGPSGSGKTTMINILTGQLLADSGQATLLGKSSLDLTTQDLTSLGLVGDSSGYYEKMTLYHNLLFFAKWHGIGKERIDEVLRQVDLDEAKDTIAEKLSTGMRQRMFLARALLHSPKILFLDEPTSGLDPTTSKKIHELLLDLKQRGTTIFLTTHDMQEATFLCDSLALLNKGVLVEQGSPREMIQKYHTDKKVRVIYQDFTEEEMSYAALQTLDMEKVLSIHSSEPTLEDIFITLTGDTLDV